MSDNTIRAYSSDVDRFLRRHSGGFESSWIDRIDALQTEDIAEYLHSLGLRGSRIASVRRSAFALKSFLAFLACRGLIKNNAAASLCVTPLHSVGLLPDQIASLFWHVDRCQASTKSAVNVQYQRDEIILFLMIIHGVRQYQICALKLSSFQTTETSVSIIVNRGFTFRLQRQMLRKLRFYLESRDSRSDWVFLDSLGRKPLDYWGIRHALNDLSTKSQLDCSPKSLHNTFLYLQQHPEIREPLIQRILSRGHPQTFDAGGNP